MSSPSSQFIVDGYFKENEDPKVSCSVETGDIEQVKTEIKVEKVLCDVTTEYQNVLIFESECYGKVLALDGTIQLTELDEFAYHETLAFTALACHPNPQRVLIIGGGDGGMAKQVIKFPTVEEVVVCDIDSAVVENCKKFFPDLASVFSHLKCKVVIEDAFDYLSACEPGSFDVIIGDCTDPDENISEKLFGSEFYTTVKSRLSAKGIVCSQVGNSMWQYTKATIEVLNLCQKLFPVVRLGFVSVPSYICGQNGFMVCAKTKYQDLSTPYWVFSEKKLDKMNMRYYDTALHKTLFTLPRFSRKIYFDNNK